MRIAATLISALCLALVALGGCVSKDDAAEKQRQPATPTFDDETGAIEGAILDTDELPIAAAEVGLQGTKIRTRTDLDGRFVFNTVPPGEYVILAAHLGFEPGSTTVVVERATVVEDIEIRLIPMVMEVPRQFTTMFTGRITCSIGHAGAISEECGNGVSTPAGTIGGNPANKIDWVVDVNNTQGLQEIYFELDWLPQSAAAQQLAFNVAHGFHCMPDCRADRTYCDAFTNYGRPVLDCSIPIAKLGKTDTDAEWDITARAWAAPVEATETPNIVLEQTFTMYRTDFFGQERPAGFTAIEAD